MFGGYFGGSAKEEKMKDSINFSKIKSFYDYIERKLPDMRSIRFIKSKKDDIKAE